MRKMNKKGFTIVELVIVIAVIAILSAVLIPTFSGVVANAETQAIISDAKAEYQQYVATKTLNGEEAKQNMLYIDDDKCVAIVNGQLHTEVNKVKVFDFDVNADNEELLALFTVTEADLDTTEAGQYTEEKTLVAVIAETATSGKLFAIEADIDE